MITLVLGFFALMSFISVVSFNRTSNDECLWLNTKDPGKYRSLIITQIKPGGVTDQAGIKDGDLLVQVDNQRIKSDLHAQSILNSKAEGDSVKYTVIREGKTIETYIRIKKLINYYNVNVSLLALIWLMVGFIVKMSKQDGLTQRLFYYIGAGYCINISLVLINPFGSVMASNVVSLTYLSVWVIASNLIPSLIIHFFSVFPAEFRFARSKIYLGLLYGIPVAITLYYTFRVIYIFFSTGVLLFATPFNITILNSALPTAYIAALILLLINFKRNKDKAKRKPLLVILISYIAGFLGMMFVIFVAPRIGGIIYNSPEYYTPVILMVLLPLAFGYSIFRYNLMDVSDVVKNTVTYGFATLLLAAIYLGLVYGLGQAAGGVVPEEYKSITALLAFIIFGLVFQSLRERIQEILTKRFYPEQFEARKILIEFSNNLSNIVGYRNIIASLEKVFVSTLKVKVFGICLWKEGHTCSCESHTGFNFPMVEIQYDSRNLQNFIDDKKLRKAQIVLERSDFESVFPDSAGMLIENGVFTAIPMMSNNKLIGFLLFGLKRAGSQFGGSDLELLVAVANQTSAAIENSRLYAAEAEKMNLEKELELARKIQQSLLPNRFPEIKGLDVFGEMVPANQVGGDYFDLIHKSGNKLYVVVGDVSGKGLAASLYMTKVQTLFQFACEKGDDPVEILMELNQKVYQLFDRSSFVTISLALFDLENRKLKFCRAGHLPLVISENGTTYELKSQGLALGLEKGRVFNRTIQEEEIALKDGQVFVFYSDGITEAMNERLEMFETGKLLELIRENKSLSANQITSKILSEVQNFRHGFTQNDDMTLVTVKIL